MYIGNSRSNCVARQQQIKLLCSTATTYQTVFQGNITSNCCVQRQQQTKLLCSKATTHQTAVFHGNNISEAVFHGNMSNCCVPRQQHIKLLCSTATTCQTAVFQGNNISNCCVPRQQHVKLLCSMATTCQTAVFQGNNTSNCCVPRQQHIKLLCCKATTHQTAVLQGNSRRLHGTHLFCREHDQKDLTKVGQKQNTYLLKTMSRNLRSGLICAYLTRVVVLPLPAHVIQLQCCVHTCAKYNSKINNQKDWLCKGFVPMKGKFSMRVNSIQMYTQSRITLATNSGIKLLEFVSDRYTKMGGGI